MPATLRGTDGSNPACSSGESGANSLSSHGRRPTRKVGPAVRFRFAPAGSLAAVSSASTPELLAIPGGARRHHGEDIGAVPRIPLRLLPLPGTARFLQAVIATN